MHENVSYIYSEAGTTYAINSHPFDSKIMHPFTSSPRTGKLQKYEVPAALTLCKEVWSPDMGLVTAAFKLKRKDIQDRYQHDINRMYAS